MRICIQTGDLQYELECKIVDRNVILSEPFDFNALIVSIVVELRKLRSLCDKIYFLVF